MARYIKIVEFACFIFPIIALLITVPYMIKQYRKYGSVTALKSLIIYSFVLYMMTAYFMTIMPLPHRSEVAKMTQGFTQLRPFATISAMFNSSTIIVNDFSTYFKTLKNPVVYTTLFNFLLTFPFGIYLRYYFKQKWWQVLICTFLLSLFYEITQLTGLYGIYPRPYRLFDVDDLIVNTIGGMLGFLFCPLFTFFLPKRDTLDERAYYKGIHKVTFSRRLLALAIDGVVISCIYFVFIYLFKFKSISGNLLVFKYIFMIIYILVVYISNGYTFGKMIVNIKLIDNNSKHISFRKVFIRYFSLVFIIFGIQDIIIFRIIPMINNKDIKILIIIINAFIYLILFFKLLINIITRKKHLFYERWSKTENINLTTIKRL